MVRAPRGGLQKNAFLVTFSMMANLSDKRTKKLRERFLGSIVGCAVGDALGAPFQGTLPSSFRVRKGEPVHFRKIPIYSLGQYTDDTQLTLAILSAICRARSVDGAEIAREFVRLWDMGEIVGPGASTNEAIFNIMIRGMSWEESGTEEGRAGNGTAMRAAPIGLWNYANPDDIERDARVSSIITHKDARSVAGTIAVAKAVQICVNSDDIKPVEFLTEISRSIRGTSELFADNIDRLIEWHALEPDRALPLIYAAGNPDTGPRQPGMVSGYVIPTVLCSLYFFLQSPRSYIDSVVGSINAGGDADTVAAITGAISGALNGISSIPVTLVETLKDSKIIQELAEQLCVVAMSRN